MLKPYLLKYLQDVCASQAVHYQGISSRCSNYMLQLFNDKLLIISHERGCLCVMCILMLEGIAKACEQNLRKTFQYGGRVEYPNGMELKAILVSGI